MTALVAYFSHIPTSHRAAIIAVGFAVLWLLEASIGASQYARARHARTNLAFWATTLTINLAMSGITLAASVAVTSARFGILHLIALPIWLNAVVAIALMDLLVAYVHHRLAHGLPLLWKFHVVHHSDPHVDSTTALRHSPIEAAIRSGFTLLGVVIFGVSPGVLVLYQAIALLAAQWIHSDIHLPRRVDRLLSLVLVSPGMHRVHHHRALPFTDSNYSTIFSVWDRLFGTFSRLDPARVVFGVDVVPDSSEREGSALRLMRLALVPAREGYRDRDRA